MVFTIQSKEKKNKTEKKIMENVWELWNDLDLSLEVFLETATFKITFVQSTLFC